MSHPKEASSPISASPPTQSSPKQDTRRELPALAPHQPPKRALTVEDLFSISSSEQSSAILPAQRTQVSIDEILVMFRNEYGKGMNLFLETSWYTEKGADYLLHDPNILGMFRAMLELFASTKVNDYENFFKLPQIEARITWSLLCLPRVALTKLSAESRDVSEFNFGPDLDRVLRRLSIFEFLITNRHLPYNPLAEPSQSSIDVDARQAEFWRELGYFITLQPSVEEERWRSLMRLRQLLDGLESRDVLYSMAVVRCGATLSTPAHMLSASRSDSIIVARKFIEDEASSKGTTQVIQRLCGMAVRSWGAIR